MGGFEIQKFITFKEVPIDTETGEKIPATKTDSGKWKIKTGEKAYRYFTEENIDFYKKPLFGVGSSFNLL